MDVGFIKAGFAIIWANDFDKAACATYAENLGRHVACGDINEFLPSLSKFKDVDCVFGGPPCQGFSVAGRMEPNDERNRLVMTFINVISMVKPRSFVMENVRALAVLEKFQSIRQELLKRAEEFGYHAELLVLNSKDFGVPQSRERMFLIGVRKKSYKGTLLDYIKDFYRESPTVREVIAPLGPAGNPNNSKTVQAKISLVKSPVLRKSAYAGMLFNGKGRPINPDVFSSTLHASMGGNGTPIIDEEQLYHDKPAWVEEYHRHLMAGGKPYPKDSAPKHLRRMTVDEAHLIQTFPLGYRFIGSQSAVFRQIGNAVPCNLAEAVGSLIIAILDGQLSMSDDKPM